MPDKENILSKKILILCDMFPPAFAPRMGYLCKYMKKAGWEPVVVTEYINENTFAFLKEVCDVTYVDFYPYKNRWIKKLAWVATLTADCLFGYKERRMAKAAARKLSQGGFGCVLCSTYRTFPLPAAYKVAKEFRLPLVADHRDIIEQYAGTEYIASKIGRFPWLNRLITNLFTSRLLNERNKVLTKADCITTVSTWHVDTLKKYNGNVRLIFNGYDPELFYPEQIKTSEFVLSYTGRLLSFAIRDPRPLFEAIGRLHTEGVITPADFRVKWYMDSYSQQLVSGEAERFGLLGYMDFYPYVEASQVPSILNNSSILLQLANTSSQSGPKGIMTTKLFEAMAVEKPMLCVRSDEACLEAAIREANAGASARTAQEAYDFIKYYFERWKTDGYTSVSVNKEVVKRYSRKEQAAQFMDLFMELQKKGDEHGKAY